MTTYDATGNVHLPTFEELRHLFLVVTKDGDPSLLQTDIPSGDPRYLESLRLARLRKQAWGAYREIICVASTARRYSDLKKSSRMILDGTKYPSPTFRKQFKAFLKLVSIHTFATPHRPDSENRPTLRLTEEFWSKEWVQQIFKKLKELDSKKPIQPLLGEVYQAMVDGATGRFVSQKTIGVDVISYIATNNPRWKKKKMTSREIEKELHEKGCKWIKTKTDSTKGIDTLGVIRKAIHRIGQTDLYFVTDKE